jgi:hypothetical protein
LHGRIGVGLGLFCLLHLSLELIARRAGPPVIHDGSLSVSVPHSFAR